MEEVGPFPGNALRVADGVSSDIVKRVYQSSTDSSCLRRRCTRSLSPDADEFSYLGRSPPQAKHEIVRGIDKTASQDNLLANSHLANGFENKENEVASSIYKTNDSRSPLKPSSPLFEPMNSSLEDVELGTEMDIDKSDSGTPEYRGIANLDGLRRARAIKAEIENNAAVLKSKGTKPLVRKRVEDDPENQLIKKLRAEQKMDWGAIANYLNEERRKNGQPPSFTTPAVYSRFVRNAPRIAAAIGEVGFDPKDYMHLRNPQQFPGSEVNMFVGAPKKRVRDPNNAKELKGNFREKSALEKQYAELETTEKTEKLMEAVACVERNFWIFVADELERTTTRMYDPKAIQSRYHAI